MATRASRSASACRARAGQGCGLRSPLGRSPMTRVCRSLESAPPAFPDGPSQGPRPRRTPEALTAPSSAGCLDRTQPRHAVRRAAAAGLGCVLGKPPALRASSGCRRRRARGERWQRRSKMPFKLPIPSTWPWSQQVLTEQLAHMTEDERNLVLHDNVARLYKLDTSRLKACTA